MAWISLFLELAFPAFSSFLSFSRCREARLPSLFNCLPSSLLWLNRSLCLWERRLSLLVVTMLSCFLSVSFETFVSRCCRASSFGMRTSWLCIDETAIQLPNSLLCMHLSSCTSSPVL